MEAAGHWRERTVMPQAAGGKGKEAEDNHMRPDPTMRDQEDVGARTPAQPDTHRQPSSDDGGDSSATNAAAKKSKQHKRRKQTRDRIDKDDATQNPPKLSAQQDLLRIRHLSRMTAFIILL